MIDIERLVDHHCHGIVTDTLERPRLEALMSEAHRPAIPGVTQFDKPLGQVMRRFCAPVLDLEPLAPADDYVRRRTELGGQEVSARLMKAARVSGWYSASPSQSEGSLASRGSGMPL